MSKNPFFENKGPFKLSHLINTLKEETLVSDIKNLNDATSKDITFFHTMKYKEFANSTKALACITKESLIKYLPSKCIKITNDNVLLLTAKITEKFYPNSITDENNYDMKPINEKFKNG